MRNIREKLQNIETLTKEQNLQDVLSVNLIGEDFGNFLKTEAY